MVDDGRRAFLSRSGLIFGLTGLGNLVSAADLARLGTERAPETTALRLGYIPLTDCAPLVVAKERGLFEAHGLHVELVREASWATIRDKVAVGALDGAQMLAAMPLAIELGLSPVTEPMQVAMSLDLGGNAVTVSNRVHAACGAALAQRAQLGHVSARALRQLVLACRESGAPRLRFGTVSRFSRHNFELRYWLAAGGIDPDRDVEIVVVPPVHMVQRLADGAIDGYCVGEPYNTLAVNAGIGHILISSYEIWNNGPEKVLGVTRRWAERHPNTLRRLIMALLEAARWTDEHANRGAVAQLLAAPSYLDLPVEAIEMTLGGRYLPSKGAPTERVPDFNVFHRYAANFPWRSHGAWTVAQMYRWGQLRHAVNVREVVERVYRPRLFREAAALTGVPYPLVDYKPEGGHDAPWLLERASLPIEMGPDRFLDGARFRPDAIADYLAGFRIADLQVDLGAVARANS